MKVTAIVAAVFHQHQLGYITIEKVKENEIEKEKYLFNTMQFEEKKI